MAKDAGLKELGTTNVADGIVGAKELGIKIHSDQVGQTLIFKAFVKNFSDTHTSQWNEETVYGRMDDIVAFQATKRAIKITFDCPSYNIVEATDNLIKMNQLKAFMYPRYDNHIMKTSPLVQMKFLNFIFNPTANIDDGLYGRFSSVDFSPNMDEGVYVKSEGNKTVIIPKLFSVSLDMKVLHTTTPSSHDYNAYALTDAQFGKGANFKKLLGGESLKNTR